MRIARVCTQLKAVTGRRSLKNCNSPCLLALPQQVLPGGKSSGDLKFPEKLNCFAGKAAMVGCPLCRPFETATYNRAIVVLSVEALKNLSSMLSGLVPLLKCWASNYLHEFEAANTLPVTDVVGLGDVKWTKSHLGWFKLNVDASVKTEDSLVGLGAVVRDHQGLFMAGLPRKLSG
ncbi:hypothetical protein ACOSP7_005340 [Xanthoceras sorbifolium]